MKINGQLTWQDYMHAQHLHTQRVWWQQLIWYIALAALVAGGLSALIPDVAANGIRVVWDYIWLPIVIAIALLLFYYVFLPRSMRQLYEREPKMAAPFEYEITPGSFLASNQFGNLDRPWAEFLKWRENKDFLLLYLTEAQYIIIPKRLCTPEQVEALKAHLEESRVPQDGVITRRSIIVATVIVVCLAVGAIIYVVTLKPAL